MWKNKLASLFLLVFSLCSYGQNRNEIFLTEKIKCEDFYTNDKSFGIFSDILTENYFDKISIYPSKSDTISNFFDLSEIWLTTSINIGNDFFKYCSTNNEKIILHFVLTSNQPEILNKIFIGMEKKHFQKHFFKQYFNRKINKKTNCIHITNLSEFDHLYFVFKNDKLALVKYFCNIFD
jgi:hypothetical protein